uniref:Uncharacterized protein n=1 Tax=Timema poppense TaxID=170557 RepID=A0A7R9D505_TIMPO|nr:unnamed protein product [Timema poppensis]
MVATRHSPISVNSSDTTQSQHSPISVNSSDTTQSQHSPTSIQFDIQQSQYHGVCSYFKVWIQEFNVVRYKPNKLVLDQARCVPDGYPAKNGLKKRVGGLVAVTHKRWMDNKREGRVSHQSPCNNYPHHSHHGGMPLDPPGTYGGLNPHHKGGRGQMVKRRRNNPPRKEYSNMR